MRVEDFINSDLLPPVAGGVEPAVMTGNGYCLEFFNGVVSEQQSPRFECDPYGG